MGISPQCQFKAGERKPASAFHEPDDATEETSEAPIAEWVAAAIIGRARLPSELCVTFDEVASVD